MRSRALILSTLLCCGLWPLGGCSIHEHTVGLGPNGIERESARQYYVFFGLIRLNDVESQRMSDGLTSYRIVTKWSFTDLLLSPVLLPLTVTTRTVTVEK